LTCSGRRAILATSCPWQKNFRVPQDFVILETIKISTLMLHAKK
jgi:hypothetical protein